MGIVRVNRIEEFVEHECALEIQSQELIQLYRGFVGNYFTFRVL